MEALILGGEVRWRCVEATSEAIRSESVGLSVEQNDEQTSHWSRLKSDDCGQFRECNLERCMR
jgi:hypothetical protein